jgi:hypothetical protein
LYDRQVNLEVVRDAITERLFGLLGTLVRRHASLHPSPENLLLMSERSEFQPEVNRALADRLNLTEGKAAAVLQRLAGEFYDWASRHPQEGEEAWLELDDNRLLLRRP